MKVVLKDIIFSGTAINVLVNTKMKAKTAFKFRKVLQVVDSNIELFNKSRLALFDKYEVKAEDVGSNSVSKEKIDEMEKEFSELLGQYVEVDIPEISPDELEDIEVTPADLAKIYWIFD